MAGLPQRSIAPIGSELGTEHTSVCLAGVYGLCHFDGPLFKTAGWTSIVLFLVYVLNTYVFYLYGVE